MNDYKRKKITQSSVCQHKSVGNNNPTYGMQPQNKFWQPCRNNQLLLHTIHPFHQKYADRNKKYLHTLCKNRLQQPQTPSADMAKPYHTPHVFRRILCKFMYHIWVAWQDCKRTNEQGCPIPRQQARPHVHYSCANML